MSRRPASNSTRERPLAMSSASATRTIAPSIVKRLAARAVRDDRVHRLGDDDRPLGLRRRRPPAGRRACRRSGTASSPRGRCGGSTSRRSGTARRRRSRPRRRARSSRGRRPSPGTMPRRNSSRASRSAMFVTIWMWTHEWSDIPSRAALTPATCHHALTCWSALTASKSWSSRRLPRVGARMRIAAIASVGVGGGACDDGGGGTGGSGCAAGWGRGLRPPPSRPGYSRPASGYFSASAPAVVLDRRRRACRRRR